MPAPEPLYRGLAAAPSFPDWTARQMPASPALNPDSVPSVALEVDVQTALALSRATTRAVTAISPKAHRAMMDALAIEAAVQHAHGGPVAELVAALIKGHLDQLK
jgi:hypothetical protein